MQTTRDVIIERSVHICVCVCTFKRPELLARLLSNLQDQITDQCLSYSVVVVDNDRDESARSTVAACRCVSPIPITYVVEPEKNIALARNMAVLHATGDLVALIDDDEVPDRGWLIQLYRTLAAHGAAGVLGPVLPEYEVPPPRWIARSNLHDRRRFPTGTRFTDSLHMRSGNALLTASLLEEAPGPFDPRFGLTGGEDADFFQRMLRRGHTFVWCDEAPVFEFMPACRSKRSFLLKRALLRGATAADRGERNFKGAAKSCLAATLYTGLLPVLLLCGQHLFMKYLVRDCDHLGKLLAICGIRPVKQRDEAPMRGLFSPLPTGTDAG